MSSIKIKNIKVKYPAEFIDSEAFITNLFNGDNELIMGGSNGVFIRVPPRLFPVDPYTPPSIILF